MDQADESKPENVVFDEHRRAQVSAAFHEYRRDEVREEWISEPDAGVSGIFRWQVVAESEARDHAQVKRKITEVVQQPRAHTGAVLYHSPTEHLPEDHGD